MTRVTTMSRGAARLTITLVAIAAIVLSLAAIARPAFAGETYEVWLQESQQGSDSSNFTEDEDCGDYTSGVVWHFILNQYSGGDTAHLIAWFQGAGQQEADASKVLPSVQHFYLNTPSDDVLNDAKAVVGSDPGDANLVLSHVCHLPEASPSPTPEESVAESATPTPEESVAESATPTPEESVAESATPTPEESVAESATPTPEGSVEGSTGTPEASLPDGAMSQANGSNPLPTVFFGLLLLASLGALAVANVKTVRGRS
jgi:hypothetical protein